jgi:hypothetical protein
MVHSRLSAMKSIGRRSTLLLAGLATAIAMFLALIGPVTQAHAGAEYFCYYLAGPYGGASDRCYSQNPQHLTWVRSYGYNHSACSDAYWGGLVASWACAPTGNWSNSYFDGSRYLQGVVRNNAGENNQIWGYQEWP